MSGNNSVKPQILLPPGKTHQNYKSQSIKVNERFKAFPKRQSDPVTAYSKFNNERKSINSHIKNTLKKKSLTSKSQLVKPFQTQKKKMSVTPELIRLMSCVGVIKYYYQKEIK